MSTDEQPREITLTLAIPDFLFLKDLVHNAARLCLKSKSPQASNILLQPPRNVLLQSLDDQTALNEALSVAPGDITPQQKSALSQLARHFKLLDDRGTDDGADEGDIDERDEESGEDSDPDNNHQPRKSASAKKPRHPWAPFLRLKSVELTDPIRHHLETHGADAAEFLSDTKLLTHGIFDPRGTVSEKFLACYQYTLHLAERRGNDNIRWCFTMLMYFDLVKVVNPGRSGKKVGYLMLKDITRFLGSNSTAIDPKLAQKQLNKWAGFGRKLDILCSTFGPGCIFYLVDLLSTNFLEFVFTASGTYHDEAFTHLKSLGLKQAAVESGADRLGADIRNRLIQPFRSAVRSAHQRT